MAELKRGFFSGLIDSARKALGMEPKDSVSFLVEIGGIDAFRRHQAGSDRQGLTNRIVDMANKTGEPVALLGQIHQKNPAMTKLMDRMLGDRDVAKSMTPERFIALRDVIRYLKNPAEDMDRLLDWSRDMTTAQIRYGAKGMQPDMAGVDRFMNRSAAIFGGYANLDADNPRLTSFAMRNIVMQDGADVDRAIESLSETLAAGGDRKAGLAAFGRSISDAENEKADIRLRRELAGPGPYGQVASNFIQTAILNEGKRLSELREGQNRPLMSDLHEYIRPDRLSELAASGSYTDLYELRDADDLWRLTEPDPFIATGQVRAHPKGAEFRSVAFSTDNDFADPFEVAEPNEEPRPHMAGPQ